MRQFFISLTAVSLLTACSSIVDGQTQNITVLTPGAENAECFLENEDMKYRVFSGQTREIMNSPHDLEVTCMASGNREKSTTVRSALQPSSTLNLLNAGTGFVYDHFSKGLYGYPETISVSFAGMTEKPSPLPHYESKERYDPHVWPIETYVPTTPVMDTRDVDHVPVLLKRDRGMSSNPFSAPSSDMSSLAPISSDSSDMSFSPAMSRSSVAPSKSGTTAADLNRTMNPQVFDK